tara:strand:- start:432 stop:656 length:225 start_codon:yes stop_codon:yes gene_type:complete
MKYRKAIAAGLVLTGLLTGCTAADQVFRDHGPVTSNDLFEDGSIRVVFEDGYVISKCQYPDMGCNYANVPYIES